MLAGAAALAAGAWGSTARSVEATHGGGNDPTALHVGQANTASATTSLARTNGAVHEDALRVTNVRGGGIYGDSPDYFGVHGNSFSSSGVFGSSDQSAGVGGYSIAPAHPATQNQIGGVSGAAINNHGVLGVTGAPAGLGMAGVFGRADVVGGGAPGGPAYGVRGESGGSYGVYGQSTAPAGTVVPGVGLAAGVYGRSQFGAGVYAYVFGPPNQSAPTYGFIGQAENGFGAWGLCSAPAGTLAQPGGGGIQAVAGVLGTSANNVGLYAISTGSYGLVVDGNGAGTVGALIRKPGGQAAVFQGNVEVQGNLHVTGAIINPAPPAQAESRTARAATLDNPEAPVALGEAHLVGGRADVRFEPAVAAALADGRYLVFLTEYDDHHALYVTRRTREGFEVRAKDSPTASGAFGYRVVVRWAAAPAAADAVPTPLHVPTIPATQGAPNLPTQGDASPSTAPQGPGRR